MVIFEVKTQYLLFKNTVIFYKIEFIVFGFQLILWINCHNSWCWHKNCDYFQIRKKVRNFKLSRYCIIEFPTSPESTEQLIDRKLQAWMCWSAATPLFAREAPVTPSPWEPMDADLGRGAPFLPASFGASFLMQQNKLSLPTNHQLQHPHLAFLSLDALYYFKGRVNTRWKRKCGKGLHDQQRRFTKSHTRHLPKEAPLHRRLQGHLYLSYDSFPSGIANLA